MPNWIERLKGPGDEPSAAQTVLSALNASQEPVRVSIEGSYHTFVTRVRLRSGAVALTYPAELAGAVQQDGWVRIQLPESEPAQDLRLQVSSARHGGSGVMATDMEHIVLLCKLAGAALVKRLRRDERVSTAKYRDVEIRLHAVEGAYRILDISLHGAKARLPGEEAQAWFPLGKRLEQGTISLGNRAQVAVDYTISRHLEPKAVGLELIIHNTGRDRALLEAFIAAVRRRELAAAAAG